MSNLRDVLLHRLQSWRSEKETNRYGLAHLADRAIRLLEADLAQWDRNPKGHDPAEGHGAEHESPVGNADAPNLDSPGEQ